MAECAEVKQAHLYDVEEVGGQQCLLQRLTWVSELQAVNLGTYCTTTHSNPMSMLEQIMIYSVERVVASTVQ